VAWVTTRSADTGANRFQGRYRDPFGRKQAAGTFSTRRAALKAALQAEGTVENGTWAYYGLQRLSNNSAVFVAPQGLNNGWANSGGEDVAFTDAMINQVEGALCVDTTRLFSDRLGDWSEHDIDELIRLLTRLRAGFGDCRSPRPPYASDPIPVHPHK